MAGQMHLIALSRFWGVVHKARYVQRALKRHNAGFSAITAFKSLSQLDAAIMVVDGERYTYISEPAWRDKITFNALGLKSPTRCVIEKSGCSVNTKN